MFAIKVQVIYRKLLVTVAFDCISKEVTCMLIGNCNILSGLVIVDPSIALNGL